MFYLAVLGVCFVLFVVGPLVAVALERRAQERWSPDPDLCWCGRPVQRPSMEFEGPEFDDSRDSDELEVALIMDEWAGGE